MSMAMFDLSLSRNPDFPKDSARLNDRGRVELIRAAGEATGSESVRKTILGMADATKDEDFKRQIRAILDAKKP